MNKKMAFTYVEILIVMLIIGIITVFAYQTLEHIDKNVKYAYSNVYHSLDRAFYNAMLFTNIKNPFANNDIETDEDGEPRQVKVEDGERTRRLCEMLTHYINSNSISCEEAPIDENGPGEGAATHFVSVNNMHFYISKRLPEVELDDSGNPTEPEPDHYFFLIFVDVNGQKRPNTIEYDPEETEESRLPDIFAFAAIDNGRICPLGAPEIDKRFMQTRIAYEEAIDDPDSDDEEDKIRVKRYSVTSKPYYISKAEAWGYYLPGDNKTDPNYYIDDNPLTFNGYIRDKLERDGKNSAIYQNIPSYAELEVPEGIEFKEAAPPDGYNCAMGSDINCKVFVDKYRY